MDAFINFLNGNPGLSGFLAALGALLGAIATWYALFKKPKRSLPNSEPTNVVGDQSVGTNLGTVIQAATTQVNVAIDQNLELRKANCEFEDTKDEWMVYEAAFLWRGFEPPNNEIHSSLMTREIGSTKSMLHRAIDNGELATSNEIRFENGHTRWVNRDELRRYALAIGEQPAFLFPESR